MTIFDVFIFITEQTVHVFVNTDVIQYVHNSAINCGSAVLA